MCRMWHLTKDLEYCSVECCSEGKLWVERAGELGCNVLCNKLRSGTTRGIRDLRCSDRSWCKKQETIGQSKLTGARQRAGVASRISGGITGEGARCLKDVGVQ